MSFIKSSEFITKFNINNKEKENYGYQFFYDGSNALIKTYDNNKSNNYFIKDNNILENFYNNQINNLSNKSLVDRLNNDFTINIKPKEYIDSLKLSNSQLKSIFTETNKSNKKNKTNKKNKSNKKNKTQKKKIKKK